MSILQLYVGREAIREHDRELRRAWAPIALGGALGLPLALWLETRLDDVHSLPVLVGVAAGEWVSSVAAAVGLWMTAAATWRIAMPIAPLELWLDAASITVERSGQVLHARARIVEVDAFDTFLRFSVVSAANVQARFGIPLDRPQRDAAIAHLRDLVPVTSRRSLRAEIAGRLVGTTARTLSVELLTQLLAFLLVVGLFAAPLLACGFGGPRAGGLVLGALIVGLVFLARARR
jgi:hypothetical protein